MKRTNRFITKRAIFEYGKERERLRPDWIMMFQGMICLASNQVWWTAEVEEVFFKITKGNKRAMKEFLAQQNKQIDDLVMKGVCCYQIYFHLVCPFNSFVFLSKIVRADLSRNDRLKFKTITTIDVHARDIIDNFVRDNVMNASEFSWESQLRFYWLKEFDNLYVTQCTGMKT